MNSSVLYFVGGIETELFQSFSLIFFKLKDIEFNKLTYFPKFCLPDTPPPHPPPTVVEYLATQDKSENYSREIVIFFLFMKTHTLNAEQTY